jgi:hypothetical protein
MMTTPPPEPTMTRISGAVRLSSDLLAARIQTLTGRGRRGPGAITRDMVFAVGLAAAKNLTDDQLIAIIEAQSAPEAQS